MNAYMRVDLNYEQDPELEFILPRQLLTEYLRELSWNGAQEKELVLAWRYTYAYIFSCMQIQQTPFQNLSGKNVKMSLAWLKKYAVDFSMEEKNVVRFLVNIKKLTKYLKNKDFECDEFDLRAVEATLFDAQGCLNMEELVDKNSKVVHIDFSAKQKNTSEVEIPSFCSDKQVLYIREHLMDLPRIVFTVLEDEKYIIENEKLLYGFEQYLQTYTKVKNRPMQEDDYELEAMEDPSNLALFAEYTIFSAEYPYIQPHPMEELFKKNARNEEFLKFIEHYKDCQFRFFRVVSSRDANATEIEDLISGHRCFLDSIYITDCHKDEVFSAYFKGDTVLPNFFEPVKLSPAVANTFIHTLKLLTNYKGREGDDLQLFVRQYSLLSRYLLVKIADDKKVAQNIANSLKQTKGYLPWQEYQDYIPGNSVIDPMLQQAHMSKTEERIFWMMWQDFCRKTATEMYPSGDKCPNELLIVWLLFLRINNPEHICVLLMGVVLFNPEELERGIEKVALVLDMEHNRPRYLTEIGWIFYIESFLNGGVVDDLSQLPALY